MADLRRRLAILADHACNEAHPDGNCGEWLRGLLRGIVEADGRWFTDDGAGRATGTFGPFARREPS